MTEFRFAIADDALDDIADAWSLVNAQDGAGRADEVVRKIEAFCFRLTELPYVGTSHDGRLSGLRSCGVPGLKSATVVFRLVGQTVTIVRVSYLGREVWSQLP